jgi:hypothetical protein
MLALGCEVKHQRGVFQIRPRIQLEVLDVGGVGEVKHPLGGLIDPIAGLLVLGVAVDLEISVCQRFRKAIPELDPVIPSRHMVLENDTHGFLLPARSSPDCCRG